MKVIVDTSVILDFLDGLIKDPFEEIHPYRILLISPVTFHEVLRAYPKELHIHLFNGLGHELLPVPTLEQWTKAASVMRSLYPLRKKQNIARMQNDILITLAAHETGAPIWSRDVDFKLLCHHLDVELLQK